MPATQNGQVSNDTDHVTSLPEVTPTVLYTWLIIVGALVALWVLGRFAFPSIRM